MDENPSSSITTLIVGGKKFTIKTSKLRKIPDTVLASLSTSSPFYDASQEAYIFCRDPDVLKSVLNIYRTGELHFPKYLCGIMVRKELEFWGISEYLVSECCMFIFNEIEDNKNISDKLNAAHNGEDIVNAGRPDSLRNKIWLMLEYPNHSIYSKIWHYTYVCIILASASIFMIWNEEIVRVPSYISEPIHVPKDVKSKKVIRMLEKDPVIGILGVDLFCMLFYSIEMVVHFFVCPIKKKFFQKGMNILNIFHVILMWFLFAMELHKEWTIVYKPLAQLYFWAMGCNALRLLMLFRVSKDYTALKVLMLTLKESWEELRLLLVTFLMGVTVFGTLIYYSEIEQDEHFSDIFESIWWAIVTMTTVGYGDLYPSCTMSRIVGSMCAVCGVLILTVPIAIIATHFTEFNNQEKYRKRRLENAEKARNTRTPIKMGHIQRIRTL